MKRIAVVLACALVASLVAAPAAGAAVHTGTIAGVVRDGDGSGIAEVCALAHHIDYPWWAVTGAITGADGSYRMDVASGSYRVLFRDCAEPRRYVEEWYDDAPDFEHADDVTVVQGQTTTADAVLALGGSIAGTITDEATGEPLHGICAAAFTDDYSWVGSGCTDESGAYVIGGLPSLTAKVRFGDHYAEATPVAPPAVEPDLPRTQPASVDSSEPVTSRYVPEWYDDKETFDDADPVSVVQGERTDGIDAALVLGGSIIGRVTGDTGEAAASVCVNAYGDGDSVGFGWTDGDGFYRIDRLREGSYLVSFDECGWESRYETEWYDDKPSRHLADPVAVQQGVETLGIDASLALRPRPDVAVTDLDVRPVPLRTDAAELVSPGHLRRVTVELGNLGSADADGFGLVVWAETVTDGRRQYIASDYVERLRVGATMKRSYTWNGAGGVGDVRITAAACTFDDADRSNNAKSAEHYVLVGGSGFGVRPAGWFGDWYASCDEVYPADR